MYKYMSNNHPALLQVLQQLQYQQLLKEAQEWRLLEQGQPRLSSSPWHERLAVALGSLLVALGTRLKQFERPVL